MERLLTANNGLSKPQNHLIPEVQYEVTDSSQTKLDMTIFGYQNNNKVNNFLRALSVIRNKGEAENNQEGKQIDLNHNSQNNQFKENIKKDNFITSIKSIQIGNSIMTNSRNNFKDKDTPKNSFSPPLTITANTTTEYDRNISENSIGNANYALEENKVNYLNFPVEKNIQIRNNDIRIRNKISHHKGRVANIPYKMDVMLKPLLKDAIKIIQEEAEDEINVGYNENMEERRARHKGREYKSHQNVRNKNGEFDGEINKNIDANINANILRLNKLDLNSNTQSSNAKENNNISNSNKLNSYRTNINNHVTANITTAVNSKNKSTHYTNTNNESNNGTNNTGIFFESPLNRAKNSSNKNTTTNNKGSTPNGLNGNYHTTSSSNPVQPFSLKINPKIPKGSNTGNGGNNKSAGVVNILTNSNYPNKNKEVIFSQNFNENLNLNSNSNSISPNPKLNNLDDLDEIKDINLNEYHFDGTGGPAASPNLPAFLNKKLNISDLDIFNLHLDFDMSNGNINNKNSKILIVDSMLNSSNSPNNIISDLNMNKSKGEESFLKRKKNLVRGKKTQQSQNFIQVNLTENLNKEKQSKINNHENNNSSSNHHVYSNSINVKNLCNLNLLNSGNGKDQTNTNTNSTQKKIRRKYFKSEIFEGKNNQNKEEEEDEDNNFNNYNINENLYTDDNLQINVGGLSAIDAFGNLDEEYEINQFVMKTQKDLNSSASRSNLSRGKVNKNLLNKFNSTQNHKNIQTQNIQGNNKAAGANFSNYPNYFSQTNLFNNNKYDQDFKDGKRVRHLHNRNKNEININENLQIDTERTDQSEKALALEEEYEIEEIDLRTDYENIQTDKNTDEINFKIKNKPTKNTQNFNLNSRSNSKSKSNSKCYSYLQATEKKDTNHKKNAFKNFYITTENSSNFNINNINENIDINKESMPSLNPNLAGGVIRPYTNYNLFGNYNQNIHNLGSSSVVNNTNTLTITNTLSNPINTINTLNTLNTINSINSNFSNTESSSMPNTNTNSNPTLPYKTPDNKIRKHNTLNDISILYKTKGIFAKNQVKKANDSERGQERKNTCSEINRSFISREIPEDSFIDTVFDLDFINNLLAKENNCKPEPNFLNKHPRLEVSYRSILVEWLMELCEEYAFKRDTFHYAVNYVDRFLSKLKDVSKMSLQLIGVTSLSIAAKFEEVQIPKIIDYLNATDNSYTQEEFIATERLILKTLRWEIIPTTINTWLNWYVCQWDLYLDSFPENIEKIKLEGKDPVYFKKADETSYIHFRTITQLIDLYTVDYYSLKYSSRCLVAASMLLVLCRCFDVEYFRVENLSLYDFDAKFFVDFMDSYRDNFLVEIFSDFMHQGFNISSHDSEFINCLVYTSKFLAFEFNFNLPLVLQGNEDNGLENGNYEDFLSYQTHNENNFEFLEKVMYKKIEN